MSKAPLSGSVRQLRARLLQIIIGAVFLLGLVLLYWRLRPEGMEDADTSVYLSGAKSLAEGNGYRFVAYTYAPRITMVPPLQSGFLSLLWQVSRPFPDNMPYLHAGMIALAALSFALVACYWRRLAVPWWGIWLILMVWGVSVNWLFLIYWMLSDILFGLFWLALA